MPGSWRWRRALAAWILPGLAFWGVASVWGYPYGLAHAEEAYASSALAGGLVLAPGGIVIAGGRLLDALGRAGFPESAAVLSVLAIRFATAGVSTALGGVMLLVHLRTASSGGPAPSEQHFDTLADAYDVQIPEARRHALLTKKTDLMREIIAAHQAGTRGLDVGCGQGWYVARMRELGFDVNGIDASAGQIQLAAANIGAPDLVQVGSALQIPAADATYDFAYTINVVHHLPSVDDQRAAFAEMFRVLRPGGLLFLHEINTRNLLFRFYMGYVFPIDQQHRRRGGAVAPPEPAGALHRCAGRRHPVLHVSSGVPAIRDRAAVRPARTAARDLTARGVLRALHGGLSKAVVIAPSGGSPSRAERRAAW